MNLGYLVLHFMYSNIYIIDVYLLNYFGFVNKKREMI